MVSWYQDHWQALLLLQALLGTFVFSYALERRSGFWLRLPLSLAAGMAAVEILTGLLWTFGVAGEMVTVSLLYVILIIIVCICNRVSIWTAMFVASSGYITQNIASCLKLILRQFHWMNQLTSTTPGVLLVDLVCYGGLYVLAYFLFRTYTRQGAEKFDNRVKAVFSVIVLLVCAGMSRVTRLGGGSMQGFFLADRIYQILCGGFILAMQYGVLERANLERSVETMRELVHQQHLQYEASKESAQLVNEKYHDLKQLLEGFRGHVPAEQIDTLEAHIGRYETFVHTGSDVLDVLLSEKRALCLQRDIQLTCYADGTALGFVEDLDLYTLLSNALTNAIEAAGKLPEGERFITLTVSQDGDMTAIHVENSCAEPVELEDGLPRSSRDPRYHGFGMKSIARITDKYGGSLAVNYRDLVFRLDILLLSPDADKAC